MAHLLRNTGIDDNFKHAIHIPCQTAIKSFCSNTHCIEDIEIKICFFCIQVQHSHWNRSGNSNGPLGKFKKLHPLFLYLWIWFVCKIKFVDASTLKTRFKAPSISNNRKHELLSITLLFWRCTRYLKCSLLYSLTEFGKGSQHKSGFYRRGRRRRSWRRITIRRET